jgi:hypothetical protein
VRGTGGRDEDKPCSGAALLRPWAVEDEGKPDDEPASGALDEAGAIEETAAGAADEELLAVVADDDGLADVAGALELGCCRELAAFAGWLAGVGPT